MLLAIFLILFGLFILLFPKVLWIITEQIKSYDATEPSKFYIITTRIGGVIFIAVGLVNIIVLKLF